jgi:predicted transcriptional regulator
MVKEHGMKQTEVSEKFGVTKGSITQYIQAKRASNSNKLNKVKPLKSAIDSLAKDLAKKNIKQKEINRRFCLICRIAQKKFC